MTRKIIVFTRYPEPGQTKTRLIPAVGPERAAEIQRGMTERTLKTAAAFADATQTHLEIWFFGGSRDHMKDWLGAEYKYVEQPDGDLGAKMAAAFHAAFQEGHDAVVIIGTDCPGISQQTLSSSFSQLVSHALVIGPTYDGGYYLIGESIHSPSLFLDIEWGTDNVFQSTFDRARANGLDTAILDHLGDVDSGEDLHLLDQPYISVIIPALNECASITMAVRSAMQADANEVIVVDGGSDDDTAKVAGKAGARVIKTDKGRALQMNRGAAAAAGDILLFLHADTRLPRHWDLHVRETLALDNTSCGAFALGIESREKIFRILEALISFRSIVMMKPYGDQALFLKRTVFDQLDGFANMPIMEDYDLVVRARKLGAVRMASASVTTSARRWSRLGILRTTLINQYIILAYHLGVEPERLAELYTRAKGAGK